MNKLLVLLALLIGHSCFAAIPTTASSNNWTGAQNFLGSVRGSNAVFTNFTVLGTLSATITDFDAVITNGQIITNVQLYFPTNATATPNRALIVDSGRQMTNSTVTDTELSYLSGVTSAIQVQLGLKQTGSANLTSWSGVATNAYVPTYAQNSTNLLLGTITNLLYATNVVGGTVGGQVPFGGVATNTATNAGALLMINADATRKWDTTLSAPIYSSDLSSSNGPAMNQVPVAGWVRSLFNVGNFLYATTNLANTAITNVGSGTLDTNVFTFSYSIPAYGSRTYTQPTNGQYVGSVMSTNTFQTFGGPATISAWMQMSGGSGGASVAVHPEIYYTYDKTNIFGDWDTQNQSITTGTNLYQFVVPFPTAVSTNSAGFYVVRRFKIGAITGSTRPNLIFHMGTNYTSHMSVNASATISSGATVQNSVTISSNSLASWPAAPASVGACAIVNSNGYPYILLSTNGGVGSATWTATNKLGW